MIITTVRRIVKTGLIDFWRSGFSSLAAVIIFTITLIIIGSLILGTAVLNTELDVLRDKVDINVYIEEDVSEDEIILLRDKIASFPEVSEVTYISREDVLAEFREANANDFTILQSLEELGFNPLLAELNVKARDPSQYATIARSIEESLSVSVGGRRIVNKVNYRDRQAAIEKLASFIELAEQGGVFASIVFIFLAVTVAFNTTALVIFNSRDEIGVMRLVGAGNEYVRGPFIVQGIIYGLIAAAFTLVLFYPITGWVSGATKNFLGGIDLAEHYISNMIQIGAVLFTSGILLGAVSSYLAVRRYLKT